MSTDDSRIALLRQARIELNHHKLHSSDRCSIDVDTALAVPQKQPIDTPVKSSLTKKHRRLPSDSQRYQEGVNEPNFKVASPFIVKKMDERPLEKATASAPKTKHTPALVKPVPVLASSNRIKSIRNDEIKMPSNVKPLLERNRAPAKEAKTSPVKADSVTQYAIPEILAAGSQRKTKDYENGRMQLLQHDAKLSKALASLLSKRGKLEQARPLKKTAPVAKKPAVKKYLNIFKESLMKQPPKEPIKIPIPALEKPKIMHTQKETQREEVFDHANDGLLADVIERLNDLEFQEAGLYERYFGAQESAPTIPKCQTPLPTTRITIERCELPKNRLQTSQVYSSRHLSIDQRLSESMVEWKNAASNFDRDRDDNLDYMCELMLDELVDEVLDECWTCMDHVVDEVISAEMRTDEVVVE